MGQTRKKYSNNILEEINHRREIMINSAQKTGFTSDDTIKFSQELDKLIFEYQCSFRHEPKNYEVKTFLYEMIIWPRATMTSEFHYI